MEIRNHETDMIMKPGLVQALEIVRNERNFQAETWLQAKAILLNDYMRHFGLKACVVGVSGGIDSAVVLGIAVEAQKIEGSPIEKIVPISIPCIGNKGVTGQGQSVKLAQKVVDKFFGYNSKDEYLAQFQLHEIVPTIVNQMEEQIGLRGNDWAQGQLISYIRTPILYYMTSLLAQNKLPAIVLGTTNLSEAGYLGYICKSGDSMVDVQMISDLYKSEVYAVARLLNIPKEIIDREPTGDLFDACPDEKVFGAPYDFVELHHETKRGNVVKTSFEDRKRCMNPNDMIQWNEYTINLENMHQYNAHKYLGRSPAVHLDIMPCAIEGGWDNTRPSLEKEKGMSQIDFNAYMNKKHFIEDNYDNIEELQCFNGPTYIGYLYEVGKSPRPEPDFKRLDNGAFTIQLIDEKTAPVLVHDIDGIHWSNWRAAGLDGYKIPEMKGIHTGIWDGRNLSEEQKKGYGGVSKYYDNLPENYADIKIGSWRATSVNDGLANLFWERIKPFLGLEFDNDVLDTEGHPIWKPVGVSSLMRFIKYRSVDEGKLFPHYDAPFVYNDRKRTLKSLVVYLKTPWVGGETRFIDDIDAEVPIKDRDLSDWKREPLGSEIRDIVKGKNGMGLCFNHRILHDGAPLKQYSQGEKIILRTDIIYSRLDWYR